MIYSGWLLEINSVIEYRAVPEVTRRFYWFLQFGGASFLAAFLVHAHIAYLRDIASRRIPRWWGLVAGLFYAAPVVGCAAAGLYARRHGPPLGLPDMVLGLGFFGVLLLIPALLISVTADISLFMRASGPTERRFFGLLAFISAMVLGSIAITNIGDIFRPEVFHPGSVAMIVLGVLPGGLLLYFVVWRNFLDYGAQRNLMYALPATFLALLYLALVRRVSGWLEPVLPPEATASVLLFVLIFLFEPLERAIGPVLHLQLAERMDRVQRLTSRLQQEAR